LLQPCTSRVAARINIEAFSISKHKASILVYVLNADINESLISKQLDINENTFNIEDSSISSGSHKSNFSHFSFLGALILNITVLNIRIY
jgi:hypothetical protein